MQTHNYWERFFHLTWHTKFNRRSITPDIEGRLYQYIRHKVAETRGAALHAINSEIARRHLLEWQRGYGSVTFGKGDLAWVIRYVENQREHHAAGTTVSRLEQVTTEVEEDRAEARSRKILSPEWGKGR